MRLAADSRARVPFALVGVVLLVTSATVAVTLSARTPAVERTAADRAVERAKAGARTALRRAVAVAGREAARSPVTEPANTPYGRVINDSTPFRDALRIRTYLAVRASLSRIVATSGEVRVTLSLPPVTDPRTLRRAKRRVRLRRAEGNDPAVVVGLRDVSVVVHRRGRVVERRRYTPELVVPTPVLALHRRVERFERQLNRGPLEGDGLGTRLTARLYAIAWARGYAQYDGAPITNVLANRHVALATNGAVLGLQRAAFGRSDRAARSAMLRETARVGLTDLLAGTSQTESPIAGPPAPAAPDTGAAPSLTRNRTSGRHTLTVGVDYTADSAFRDFATGKGPRSLSGVLDDVYSADVRLVARTERLVGRTSRNGPPPDGWRPVGRTSTTSVHVTGFTAVPPAAPPGFHRLATYGRRVVRVRRVVSRWRRGNRTRRTAVRHVETFRVGLAVVGRHAVTPFAPTRPIRTVHQRGGPLDGPNLADVRDGAVRRLVTARGGADRLARRAVSGSLDTSPVSIRAARPAGLRRWVYDDVAALRERVRSLSVTLPSRRAATANPARKLAARLRHRRASLVDAPAQYGSVASKARIAARRAYLDRVIERLDARAADSDTVRGALGGLLARANVSPSLLQFDGPGGSATRAGNSSVVAVEGAPPYLSLSAVRPRGVPGVSERYYPLSARTRNLFTVPYGDAADGIVAGLFDSPDRVSLGTAARALRMANQTVERTDNATLVRRRNRLRRAVSRSMERVRTQLRRTLRRRAPELSPRDRRAAVRAGLAHWTTVDARAAAASNGSLGTAVARAATARLPKPSGTRRDLLAVSLRVALVRARRTARVRPPESTVDPAASTTKRLARRILHEQLSRGIQAASDRLRSRVSGPLSAVPAGLPIAPVPGYWYATANVWTVTVRGGYARFTVRAAGGTPAETPNATVSYVRQAGNVTLDVDGDGVAERLGRTTPVTFETSTAVLVVVPPGGKGVGDVGGNADERSAGWGSGRTGARRPQVTTPYSRGPN